MLPEVISKEPLGPYVRDGDSQWLDIVRWTHYAMLEAEERGITPKSIDALKREVNDPNLRLLLGVDPGNGKALGLERGLGLQHRQAGRQLRRDLREERRHGLAAQVRARRQRAVEQGRADVPAAAALVGSVL